jgi:hypothetical protein
MRENAPFFFYAIHEKVFGCVLLTITEGEGSGAWPSGYVANSLKNK